MANTLINQQPYSSSFSESPIEYTFQTDTVGSSSLLLTCDLYIWSGSIADKPAQSQFTLKKFPIKNQPKITDTSVTIPNTAIFNVSPILDSYMSASLIEIGLASDETTENKNHYWFTAELNEEWKSGNVFVSSSFPEETKICRVFSGYNQWGENQGYQVTRLQEKLPTGVFLSKQPSALYGLRLPWYDTSKNYYFSVYNCDDGFFPGKYPIDSVIVYGNVTGSATIAYDADLSAVSSSHFTTNFQLDGDTIQAFKSLGNDRLFIGAFSGSLSGTPTQVGLPLGLDLVCQKKYTPISIFWRNRYGRFDQFQFNLVSRETFEVTTKSYKQNPSFLYDNGYDYTKGVKVYDTEGSSKLTVNTDFIPQSFNLLLIDMMLSPEIYIQLPKYGHSIYNPFAPSLDPIYQNFNADVLPLTLESKSQVLKSEEVDKLVQYTFTFNTGTPYKLSY